jgi:hypothetical protein
MSDLANFRDSLAAVKTLFILLLLQEMVLGISGLVFANPLRICSNLVHSPKWGELQLATLLGLGGCLGFPV